MDKHDITLRINFGVNSAVRNVVIYEYNFMIARNPLWFYPWILFDLYLLNYKFCYVVKDCLLMCNDIENLCIYMHTHMRIPIIASNVMHIHIYDFCESCEWKYYVCNHLYI